MTVITDEPETPEPMQTAVLKAEVVSPAPYVTPEPSYEPISAPPGVGPRSNRVLAAVWLLVTIASMGLVLYVVEPVFQVRDQAALFDEYTAAIDRAANESSSLYGVTVPTKAVEMGAPVGILEIGDLRVQQVVVEGVSPSSTQRGPGHVPGTAAPGQPGNSVVLARRGAFGGPFRDLRDLGNEDQILVTTTQGQVVYRVESVEEKVILPPVEEEASTGAASTGTVETAVVEAEESVAVDELYGPTEDDRLTLVTSAQVVPWNSSAAIVVTAKMVGKPFPPTPQNGRVDSATGLSGEGGAWAAVVLSLLALAASSAFAVFLYRNASMRSAYLLTTPALVAFTILAAENLSRLFPAWM